jgi:hypothetical protein
LSAGDHTADGTASFLREYNSGRHGTVRDAKGLIFMDSLFQADGLARESRIVSRRALAANVRRLGLSIVFRGLQVMLRGPAAHGSGAQ